MLFLYKSTNASAILAIKAAAPTPYIDLLSLDKTIKPLAKSFSLSVTTTQLSQSALPWRQALQNYFNNSNGH